MRGLTKKGKEFFRFSTALTDAITHLEVAESHIWASCQQVHNHYVDGAEQGLYMAPDVITATDVSQDIMLTQALRYCAPWHGVPKWTAIRLPGLQGCFGM